MAGSNPSHFPLFSILRQGQENEDGMTVTTIQTPIRRRSARSRKLLPYLLVMPAVIYLLLITLYPGIYALIRSFYSGKFKLEWAGFDNYAQLFSDGRTSDKSNIA